MLLVYNVKVINSIKEIYYYEAHKNYPNTLHKELSKHRLRRMPGVMSVCM